MNPPSAYDTITVTAATPADGIDAAPSTPTVSWEDRISTEARERFDDAGRLMKERPLASIAIGVGLGLLLARVLK